MRKWLSIAASAVLVLSVVGCGGEDGTPGVDGADTVSNVVDASNGIVFNEVAAPSTDLEKRSILATDNVTINRKNYPLSYNTIIRSGDVVGSGTYGLIYDKNGDIVTSADGSNKVSVSNDFASLLPIGEKLFMVSHFETRPAAMYLTELSQDKTTGQLTAVSTKLQDN